MDDNQMDEFFRNKLKDHSSPVPENMWQRIKPENDKDRKVFILWYWYFPGAMLLIASLTAGYFMWNTNKGSDKKNNISAVSKSTNDKSIIPDKETNKNKNIELRNIKQDSKYDSATHEASLSKTGTDVNTSEIIATKKGIKNAETDQYIASKKTSSNRYKRIQKIRQSNSSNDPQPPGAKDDHNLQGKDKQDSLTAISQQNNSLARIAPDSLNNKQLLKKSSDQIDSLRKKESDSSMNHPKRNAFQSFLKKKDWFLEAYGSPDIAFNNINPDYKYFHSALSFTSGLRLGKSFGKHLSGKIGFQYSQINESSKIDSLVLKWHFHYKSIDLPLLVGYEIKNQHYTAIFNAGVIYNIYSWYSGQPFGVNANTIYKQHTGMSLYIGLNYAKPINDRLLLFTEPYFRYRLSDMTNKDQYFTQKINVAGLTLGVRYDFRTGNQRK